MSKFTESVVEDAALAWLESFGWSVKHGPDIAPGEPAAERADYGQVVLADRLRAALPWLNPSIPADALGEAFRKVTRPESPSLAEDNHRFHRFLVDGVTVEYTRPDGSIAGDNAWLADFDDASNNDWLVVNQFTVIEANINRRPDIVVFLNGVPVGVIELKNPADENATVTGAINQLQTYKHDIPSLFRTNGVLVASDGIEARAGTITADREWFLPWRTVEGDALAPKGTLELETLIKGIFEKRRFLDLLRHFIVFEVDGGSVAKKMAAYHQFHAVNRAVASTVEAAGIRGDKRGGVIWHTQGSGKSLSMAFYAGKIILHPAMGNPTLVMLTDRNDLDHQLFGTFSRCHELLRQKPVQAESRDHLKELLQVAAGGVVFTTIQKFFPEEKGERYPALSERRNIVVIADEAHRSQYDFIDGFARHLRDALPNASFIGFTATPLEKEDRSTPAVFGDYIDIYDVHQSVEDGATVPIYYESRLARIELSEAERPRIDPDFEEVTEGEELDRKEKLKTKWARLEAVVGAEKRVAMIARDIVEHFERRLEAMDGKGMVVCMSRRICVDLYDAIIKLRPDWHSDDDKGGFLKVVMTGSAGDPVDWQPQIRTKERREAIRRRMQDPKDPIKLAVVRDMWLTGFDAPPLHTMYVDKPMRGHGLMQAIARVNRVFKDKPGGLVVDYLGLADQLKRALADYSEGDREKTGVPQAEAIAMMREKHEIACGILHGFDYSKATSGSPAERLALIPAAMEHILAQEGGRERFMQAVLELSKAFALAAASDEARAIGDDVGFFQAVRAAFAKSTTETGKSMEDLDTAIQQIVSKAVSSTEVVDIFSAAGLKAPDISILSDEFLAEVRGLKHRNLALELLRKLINDEIKARSRRNVVQARSFAELLERTIQRYKARLIETSQVIEELIELAKEMRQAHQRGEELGLSEEEVAFYDALATSESAVEVLGDEVLRTLARELVEAVKRNATIDWTVRASVRAKLRVIVKRTLRRYGYPPDQQEAATRTVLEQAEVLSAEWAA